MIACFTELKVYEVTAFGRTEVRALFLFGIETVENGMRVKRFTDSHDWQIENQRVGGK